MSKLKVLIVDDDVMFGQIISMYLNDLGYETHFQSTLSAIRYAISEINPNIILLDVEVGAENSIDFMPEITAVAENIPIIFMSSHVDCKIIGRAMSKGGVAYLKKPFEMVELVAYIKRHATQYCHAKLEFGDYVLDIDEKSLYHNGELVKQLTTTEYKIFRLLILSINKVVSREEIYHVGWGDKKVTEHSTNNFISKLRAYLARDKKLSIISVLKVGYKLILKK